MKIKFLRDCKYPQNDPSQSRDYKAGETYEVEPSHGQRWINRGAAVEVTAKAKPEAMVPSPPAKAHESIAAVRKAAAEKV